MATLKDIAKSLNLSVSTVSRSLNDHPSISQKTKDLVNAEIKRVNYSPNSIAKSLSENKSYTITLFVDIDDEQSYQNPFFYEIMHGIEKFVYLNEYNLVIANMKTKIRKQSVLEWLINSKRTDGLILPSAVVDDELVNILNQKKIPFVSIGEPKISKTDVNWVDVDNYRGAYEATDYLVNHSGNQVAFVGFSEDKLFSQKRLNGYLDAMKNNLLKLDNELIIKCDHTKEAGYHAVKQLLKDVSHVDAILCGDDNLCVGAIKAIKEMDMKIPKDITLISFDNEYIAKLSYPEISTINVDMYALGYQSAKLLFDQIDQNILKKQNVLIDTKMVLRETTY